METNNIYYMNMEINLFDSLIGDAKVVYELYKDEITNDYEDKIKIENITLGAAAKVYSINESILHSFIEKKVDDFLKEHGSFVEGNVKIHLDVEEERMLSEALANNENIEEVLLNFDIEFDFTTHNLNCIDR